MKRLACLLSLTVLCGALSAQAPYVTLTGKIQGANGLPAANNVLSLQPTQTLFVAGVTPLVVAPLTVECGTSIDGTVVGVPNPIHPPVVSAVGTGTLPAGNYYVKIAWYDAATHTTLVSPEVQIQLVATGAVQVLPPLSGMPANAAGSNIYIGATSGSETFQGTVAGSGGYLQNVPLVAGAAVPSVNTTICQVIANDASWPPGTGYNASLTSPSGSVQPGYPMVWQLLGPGNTINLGNGLPYYNGTVTYPPPLLALPYNNGPQGISGPLSMTGYNLYSIGMVGVGTALPAWGVDVEGSGLGSFINAKGGYLVNGSGGTAGQCLASDGTAYDVPVPCGIFYQTLQAAGSPVPQEPILNFVAGLSVTDDPTHTRTNISLVATKVQLSLPSTPVAGNTCTTAIPTAMPGVVATSTFSTAFATDPTGATGWGSTGGMVVELWPDASPNVLDWSICNQTSSPITPTAIVLNVGVN